MADLTWGDVVLIGLVATLGILLLGFWFSGLMSRKGWTLQVRSRPGQKTGARPDQEAPRRA